MSWFRITLIRSGIGLPVRTRRVLEAMGLRRRMKTVFWPVSTHMATQIMRVKELVSVEDVEKPLSKREVKAERQPDPGYYIESGPR